MKQLLISCGVLLLMAGFAISGCEKTPDDGTFFVRTNTLKAFAWKGGSQQLSIFSSYGWSASSSASWCKISSKSGPGGTSEIFVSVDPGSDSPRTAVITFTCNGQKETVKVSQRGEPHIATVEIPATTGDGFWMGMGETSEEHNYPGYPKPSSGPNTDEYPVHQVKLSAFRMGETLVTNEQYAKFLNAAGIVYEEDLVSAGFTNTMNNGCRADLTVEGVPGTYLLLLDCKTFDYRSDHDWGITYKDGQWVSAPGYKDFPVTLVSWYGAVAFCQWLSSETGQTWRLPTEAEWEYACRGKSNTPEKAWEGQWCFGNDGEQHLGEYAWFYTGVDGSGVEIRGNSLMKPHAVGQKKPNSYGLYDMHGNVSEWCSDKYLDTYYRETPEDGWNNPTGPGPAYSSYNRVVRGGNSLRVNSPNNCRSAFRDNGFASGIDDSCLNRSFRVVLELP